MSPRDTPLSSSARFAIEVAAWVAGPWAAAHLSGSGWVAIPTAVVLLALPSVFNVPGDKNVTGVAVQGTVRLSIELLLLVVAIGGAWSVWPAWLAVIVTVSGVVMITTGLDRYRWMLTQPE